MNVAVVYESKTGTTRRIALGIGDQMFERGIRCTTAAAAVVDATVTADADLVVIGTWVDGLFAIGQRPGGKKHLQRAVSAIAGPDGTALNGKDVLLYCTYAVTPGATLGKMAAMLEPTGARVIGGLAIRRDQLGAGVERLAQAVSDLSTV
jgi:hypothetical protein